MLSEEQVSFLDEFMLGKINKSQLIHFLGKEYKDYEFEKLLDEAIQKKNNQLFYRLFWYLPVILSDIERDKIYKKYITIKDGHFEHEEMLNYFHKKFDFTKETVIILKDLIVNPPKYFINDDSINVFINKCLFTIAKQPFNLSAETLKELVASKNQFISIRANSYLQKLIINRS